MFVYWEIIILFVIVSIGGVLMIIWLNFLDSCFKTFLNWVEFKSLDGLVGFLFLEMMFKLGILVFWIIVFKLCWLLSNLVRFGWVL